MADIKLVALDLDGTLFNSNGKITEKTREEIQEHCDHNWGEEHWTWSCGGYRKCTKCGKIAKLYERD